MDPWQPPCSRSTWQCGRRCWGVRKMSNGHQVWIGHRTKRSSAWFRGGQRATVKRVHLSCAGRRRTVGMKQFTKTLKKKFKNNLPYRRTRWTLKSSTTSKHKPSIKYMKWTCYSSFTTTIRWKVWREFVCLSFLLNLLGQRVANPMKMSNLNRKKKLSRKRWKTKNRERRLQLTQLKC